MKKGLLSKKDQNLKDLGNSQLSHISKNDKACSEEHSKGVDEQPCDKEIMGMTHGLNQPSQQKPEIEMELYQQRHCQFELKGREEVGWDKGRPSDFLGSAGSDHRATWL